MRIAWSEKDFFESLESAKSESSKSFGDSDMIIEKFVEKPRHVEVQVRSQNQSNFYFSKFRYLVISMTIMFISGKEIVVSKDVIRKLSKKLLLQDSLWKQETDLERVP